MNAKPVKKIRYDRYLGQLDVWAIAYGCIVGWGAFVMPGTTFLPLAGPVGSIAGLVTGIIIMLVIGSNYAFLMKRKPSTGGTYSYTKDVFGRDHAFICSWFLSLSYLTIVFLNATALFVMSRTISGNLFQTGFHYQVAGYDIYLGELVLSTFALAIVGLLFIGGKPLLQALQTVLSFILLSGVLLFGIMCIPRLSAESLFSGSTSGEHSFPGFITIVLLSPWAFVGFDAISLETVHFRFPVKQSRRITVLSILLGGLTYISLTVLSISAVPEGYNGWQDYIRHLDGTQGIQSIPPFYAAETMLGQAGLALIVIVAVAAIFTGIIGAYRANTRMLSTMAQDKILSKRFLETPFCILFIMFISIVISFVGRNALEWFVDLTSFGAIVGFCYTSAAAWKKAIMHGVRRTVITGALGTILSAGFLIVHLISKVSSVETMCPEAFLLLALWCLLGFVFYWRTMSRSSTGEYSGNTVAATVLFCLLVYSSLMWFIKSLVQADNLSEMKMGIIIRSIVLLLIIASGLAVMLYIQSVLQKRHTMMWRAKIHAEESSKAKSHFLFNISHDIRTPMNAIIGYTHILLDEKELPEEIRDYVEKIDLSGKHLLTLINDVLEMSLIESGKLELDNQSSDLIETIGSTFELLRHQMEEKHITYTLSIVDVQGRYFCFDKARFSRVILNLLSNAYKFTPEGGKVDVVLKQTGKSEDKTDFELSVRDNGIGMTEEFARTVFEAFERERTSTVSRIQGTGLGMAITKNIVNAAGGNISVNTAPGKGTEFVITLQLKNGTEAPVVQKDEQPKEIDFSSKRVLLVEDIEINRQIAEMLLTRMGFRVETAQNGLEAVEKLEQVSSGYYDAVLMDIQMPVMNGYEATKRIRSSENPSIAGVPIIAVTANAFGEDVRKAQEEGMNAHIAKPIDPENLRKVLTELLSDTK